MPQRTINSQPERQAQLWYLPCSFPQARQVTIPQRVVGVGRGFRVQRQAVGHEAELQGRWQRPRKQEEARVGGQREAALRWRVVALTRCTISNAAAAAAAAIATTAAAIAATAATTDGTTRYICTPWTRGNVAAFLHLTVFLHPTAQPIYAPQVQADAVLLQHPALQPCLNSLWARMHVNQA